MEGSRQALAGNGKRMSDERIDGEAERVRGD